MVIDNPYCMRCGSTMGGPYGHETNECTWGREGAAAARAAHPTFFRRQS